MFLQTFFTVFMSVIREKAGPTYDVDMEEAWRTFTLRLMKTVDSMCPNPYPNNETTPKYVAMGNKSNPHPMAT